MTARIDALDMINALMHGGYITEEEANIIERGFIADNNREESSERVSNRVAEWDEFSAMVREHIAEYTVKQYGDYPNDQATSWSAEMCAKTGAKYGARFNTNQRSNQTLLDMIKMAHWACLAWRKAQGLPS
jgi:hypothetical protein